MNNIELFEVARRARLYAKNECTGYKTGVAVLALSGRVYVGCNIESSSIPSLSICAERVAIQSAIANGEKDLKKILIVSGKDGGELEIMTPCGSCRQFMFEICNDIIVAISDGKEYIEYDAKDLLPATYSFVK